MIYLLQDCYEDQEGNFHRILKIGYSSKPFEEGRKSTYDTHNYGYKLISEREGSLELENYLHRRLRNYRLSLEWFKYDLEIIKIFNEVSESDVSQFTSQEELNEYIRDYILTDLVPSVSDLSDLYLKDILEELKKKSKEYPELEYNEDFYKNEILGVFKYVSSQEKEYFENLDFEDLETKKILFELGLKLSQIAGRQRKEINPYKNIINLFYRIKRKEEVEITQEEFKKSLETKKKETIALLDLYKKGNDIEKAGFIKKLKRDSELYHHDFVGISKITNQPIYNYLIDIANERAWEVSQKDYQDKISVTKSLSEQGFYVGEYKNENDQIASDFLDNHFYQTGFFHEKLKMYCEFCDTYKDNLEIMDILDHRIENPRFKQFYDYFGTKECKSKRYQELPLLASWGNDSKEDKFAKEIYLTFKPGDRYSLKDLKEMVREIYQRLGITKTPKATDLGNYFKLIKTRITLPDKTVVSGFKLEKLV